MKPPDHAHMCFVCKGLFPCWEARCSVADAIICEDCAEDQIERVQSVSSCRGPDMGSAKVRIN